VAPTPLTATVRYIPPGTRKVYWLTTIASYATAVTRAEINAGIDLTNEIAEMSGFAVTSASTDTPDLATRFTAKIPGRITADDSSISFYASSTSADVRTVLPRDTAGYVIILPEGDVPTQKMDVYPAKVASTAVDTAMEDPEKINVAFTVTRIPALNLVIPA
jgi:hypothetical protein